MKTPIDMVLGFIHKSKRCSSMRILNYVDSYNVDLEFIDTNYKTRKQASAIRRGHVSDPYARTVIGVGYFGEGKHKGTVGGVVSKSYMLWTGMIARCYSENRQANDNCYIGTTVCDEWHNYQCFADWFDVKYSKGLEIDKDIMQEGVKNKVYSPDNCIFVSQKVNSVEANAKHYLFRNPEGKRVKIYNLTEFCRGKGLSRGNMGCVHRGERAHHKGWEKG